MPISSRFPLAATTLVLAMFLAPTSSEATIPRAYLQYGVQVQNDSGTAIQLCNITLRVEPMERVGQ